MTQLVAEKVLVVLDVRAKPERPKHTPALRQKIPDAPSYQDSYEVVVKRPPRIVASREGVNDETYAVVDDHRRDCERSTVSIARDRDSHFRLCEKRSDIAHPGT